MTSLALCALAALATYMAGLRSLRAGLFVLLVVGYLYGILRANVLEPFSHFIFDAAVVALYAAWLRRPGSTAQLARLRPARAWLVPLVGWPLLLALLPVQDPLIRLVGLRASVFFLPFIVLGGRLSEDDFYTLAKWIAALNLAALAVAIVQFQIGIEPFFPRSAVTEIMYRSRDIVGTSQYRIPSTFTSAHAYAGATVMTLPLLLGAWWVPGAPFRTRLLLGAGATATTIGIFMTGARLPVVLLFTILLAALLSTRIRFAGRFGLGIAIVLVAVLVDTNERLQRFRTLEDTEMVAQRVRGSVNAGFFELARDYPLGNGIGGGGSSVPYFLVNRLEERIGMENEYARIVAEQGLPGLAMWICFIVWVFARRLPQRDERLFLARRLAVVACATSFASGLIGTGLLTAIPQSVLFTLYLGWLIAPKARQQELRAADASPLGTAVPLRPLGAAW